MNDNLKAALEDYLKVKKGGTGGEMKGTGDDHIPAELLGRKLGSKVTF